MEMQTMIENYLDLTLDEVYNVITNVNVWPSSFNTDSKIKFINALIKYYEDREEYEKCGKLHRIIQRLENNQSSIGCSGIESN